MSHAVQPAVHDVTDASALRSWFNPPMAASLAAELYKVRGTMLVLCRLRPHTYSEVFGCYFLRDCVV